MFERAVYCRILVIFGFFLVLLCVAYTKLNAEVTIQQDSQMIDCMTACIRSEGKSQTDKCKWRCANFSSPSTNSQDCMAI